MKFRRKPAAVEAWSVEDLLKTIREDRAALPPPVIAALDSGALLMLGRGFSVTTNQGPRLGLAGDMLALDERGAFCPYEGADFAQEFETDD